ncbi:TetR/AcrR family transcriptional regulator [Actinophytocola sp. NPDC049390]|uniref:TetR/AcrR family transcriptional regulator n=1 Tax=Actinophytocola sp. NPDC049390 TaxID=3363894 RepID=UPI0037BAA43A
MKTYGGASPDERKTRRRAALREAALDLLAEGGWERVTVRGVCARAKLNDRYFYESFRDPAALLLAVREQVTAHAFAVVAKAIADTAPDPDVRVRAVIVALVDFFTEDPRRGHLLVQSQATDELRAARQTSVRAMARVVADQGAAMLGAQAPPEPDRELAALTLVHGTLELFASWLRGELDITRTHLVDFLVAMVRTTEDLAAALRRQRG